MFGDSILDQGNKATLSRVIAGINWCIESDIDIINMSFGTSIYSEAMHYGVQRANDAGILMVASAGNGGTNSGVEYPAAFEEVVAVGAIGTDGKKTEESSTGSEIELVASGEQIKADGLFGGTVIASGTSMSAPQVVGVAAVLLEKDHDKTLEFIRRLMKASAKHLGGTLDSAYYGNGVVDLDYALQYYDEFENSYTEIELQQKIIPENERDIITFEEIDYVEGR